MPEDQLNLAVRKHVPPICACHDQVRDRNQNVDFSLTIVDETCKFTKNLSIDRLPRVADSYVAISMFSCLRPVFTNPLCREGRVVLLYDLQDAFWELRYDTAMNSIAFTWISTNEEVYGRRA